MAANILAQTVRYEWGIKNQIKSNNSNAKIVGKHRENTHCPKLSEHIHYTYYDMSYSFLQDILQCKWVLYLCPNNK